MDDGVHKHVFERYGFTPGYDALYQNVDVTQPIDSIAFAPNNAYDRYFRIHKVLVGDGGARQLEDIHESLQAESLPRYLSVAGSAAAESAFVRSDVDIPDRLKLLDKAVASWQQALVRQQWLNVQAPDVFRDYALPGRLALDIATAPLIGGVIRKDMTESLCKRVFMDCLNIAQSNVVKLELASRSGNTQAVGEHVGFAYECNALLAFNRRFSPTWFAMPAMARCDSGMEYYDSTHDLLVIHQKRGFIKSATPAEIKASASLHDRNRYKALLVRGKMHLSVPGKYRPEYTLNAIGAAFEGNATSSELTLADGVTDRLIRMVRDYYAGKTLGTTATRRTATTFHDMDTVRRNHPGLQSTSPQAAA